MGHILDPTQPLLTDEGNAMPITKVPHPWKRHVRNGTVSFVLPRNYHLRRQGPIGFGHWVVRLADFRVGADGNLRINGSMRATGRRDARSLA